MTEASKPSPKNLPGRASGSFLPFLTGFLLIFSLGLLLSRKILPLLEEQERRLEVVEERLGRIEEVLSLLRFAKDPEKESLPQVLAALDFWARELEDKGSSLVERKVLEERIEACRKAVRALGKAAVPELVRIFETPGPERRLEYRRNLLRLIDEISPREGEELAARTLKNPAAPSSLRVLAARLLKRRDGTRAGLLLAKILVSESRKGVRHPMPGSPPLERAAASRGFPNFFDLISIFMETDYPHKGETLLLLLDQPEHGIATLNECLKGLISLKEKKALPRLKAIFQGRRPEFRNPLFRMNVARAIAEIAGKGACAWLEAQIVREGDPTVLTRLQQLFSRTCG